MVVETPPRISPAARWFTALLVTVAPVVVIVVTYGWWQGRLPDPLPTHWSHRGQVDGTTAQAGFATIMLIVAGAGALLGVAGASLSVLRWHTRRTLLTVGAPVGAFAAALWLTIATLSLDRVDAVAVPDPTWHIPAMVLAAAVWAALVFLVCGPAPARAAATGRPDADLPRVDLAPGQRAVWSEAGYTGATLYLVLLLLVPLAVALTVWVHIWAASPVILAAALTLFLLTIRLRVDGRGFHVGFGPGSWPRITVPLREIESAQVTTVQPSEWGGWGYRMKPGRRGVILRAGPGVRLTLSENRQLVASTRDPETVAGLLNTMIDRQRR